MDGTDLHHELADFTKVWFSVIISLCYCYFAGKITTPGTSRFFSLLPIVSLFLFLPLNLTTIHLCGTTAFFIAWLANFKLLLFAFDKGPLATNHSMSLPRFIALACLPIKIQSPSPKGPNKDGIESPLNYAIKGVIVALLVRIYDFNEFIHPKLLWVLYCIHIYFVLEILLAGVAAVTRVILGFELEPQFNKPYLSTSLQNFWGRRWNLMVTRILRPTVYEPCSKVSTRVVGKKWAALPAIMSTFLVSGLMHELIFYYLARVQPTWEVTRFFMLHGVCLAVEIILKKVLGDKWRLPRPVSGPLTVVFVLVTCFWLFFPQFITRCKADVRAFQEYAALGAFVKNTTNTVRAIIFDPAPYC